MINFDVRNLLLGAIAIASLGLTACGGGFSCNDKGKCSNDVTPDANAVATCNAAINDPKCGSKAKDFLSCAESHASCDANGKSTVDASACASQSTAYQNCILGK